MNQLKLNISEADTSSSLQLEYASDGVKAGFPSPAQDYLDERIDLNRHLVLHPASTFFAKVSGDSMCHEGIDDGDLLIIDKSLEPEDGDLAVCCLDGEFTLKRIKFTGGNRLFLVPSNDRYPQIEVTSDNEFVVWGIVTNTIKYNRRPRRRL
jgi:DNA polymerase V